MLDDIALFIHVAQHRSLSAAAIRLKLPAATVTRRLRKLEEEIGAQLVHRSARKFALTSEGEAYYEAFADLVQQAEHKLRGLSTELNQLSGRLRVAAPTNISIGILEPMWSSFLKSYPEIQLTLALSNDSKDLEENRFDLALRIGPQTDVRLYQKRIGTVATVLVASDGYLAGAAALEEPQDLRRHRLIWISSLPHWRLTNLETGAQELLHLNADIAVDDISLARQLAADGHGIVLLPVSELFSDLETGALRVLLPSWQGQRRDVYAVWPTGRLLSARAKLLRDFMEDYLSDRPVFQGGLPF
ncbi:LysR substrate-binding domain-containing protein [Roseibium sp.]|uniref:LysR family transcriptional regulator n=1 Tax=Roseibium sp. TaxID=1936156 RepID=UPI003D139398